MRVILIACLATLISVTIAEDRESLAKRSINEKSFEEKLKEGNELLKNEPSADATMQLLKKLHNMKEELINELPAAVKPSADEEKAMEEYVHMEKSHMELEPMGDTIDEINRNSKVASALFQGDMLLTKEQADEIMEDVRENAGKRSKRQAFRDKNYPKTLWDRGVNFDFYNATEDAKRVFRKAAAIWSWDTCINFGESPRATDKILVLEAEGCWSQVGRIGGTQGLSLGKGCKSVGLALHEIGHAIGLYHSQSRHDRDNFVTLHFENLRDGWEDQFVKQTEATNYNYNLTYDYGSVMQYGATSVSKNGKPYIVPKDIKFLQTLGSHFIAFYDRLMINLHYGCLKKCEQDSSSAKCENGGYPHPRDCSRCICPSGYGGNLCNDRPGGCGKKVTATKEFQMLNVTAGKDKYDREGINDEFEMCYYWIEGPPGSRIEVVLDHYPEDFDHDGCKWGGVEIKTLADKRHTGYRFCAPRYDGTTLVSTHNIVPVIGFGRAYKVTATVRYRIASSNPETSETTPQPTTEEATSRATSQETPQPTSQETPQPVTPSTKRCNAPIICAILKEFGLCRSPEYDEAFKEKFCPGTCN